MIMKYMQNYLKSGVQLVMLKEIKELIQESEENLQEMMSAAQAREYSDAEHIADQAWEEGYQAGLRAALAIIKEVGLDEWEEE